MKRLVVIVLFIFQSFFVFSQKDSNLDFAWSLSAGSNFGASMFSGYEGLKFKFENFWGIKQDYYAVGLRAGIHIYYDEALLPITLQFRSDMKSKGVIVPMFGLGGGGSFSLVHSDFAGPLVNACVGVKIKLYDRLYFFVAGEMETQFFISTVGLDNSILLKGGLMIN